MPHLSRASYSWKKYPTFLTTERQQFSGFIKFYHRRFGQDSDRPHESCLLFFRQREVITPHTIVKTVSRSQLTGASAGARLLKRVFDVDVEHCPNCGGALKIIAAPSTGSGQA